MNITAHRLYAAAGICAAAAGAIFIAVQINHPPADVAHIGTTEMMIRETAKAVMAALALVGITGMFVRNRHRFGALGLAGYLLFSIGYLAMFAVQCIAGYVLPTLALTSPAYAQDVLDAAVGNNPAGDIGNMQYLLLVAGMGYAIGGLLFGIALFRARILARWASALLAYATVAVLALTALPDSFSRPFAVPAGVAMIGLGVSLWRDQRRHAQAVTATEMIEYAQLVPS
jgi:hypothetical protein